MSTAKKDFHSASIFLFVEIITSELIHILNYILPCRLCEQWRIFAQNQGGEEYPTYNKNIYNKKEGELDWSHLVYELASETRF
jgi:hypothetical protein